MEVIKDMFGAVDNLGKNFVQNGYEALSKEFNTVMYMMLTVYIIWWGYQIMFGRSTLNGEQIAFRVLRVMGAVLLATNWGIFAEYIYKIIQDVPTGIADVLIDKIGGAASAGSSTGIVGLLDRIYSACLDLTQSVSNKGSFIMGPMLGILFTVVCTIFLAIAIGVIMAAKVLLFITLALAPVFIILAIFGYTFRFLEGWINTVVTLFLMQVFIFVFLAFYYNLIIAAIEATAAIEEPSLSDALPFLLMMFVGIFSMTYIPQIASTIGGATFQNFAGASSASWRSVKRGGKNAAATGVRTVKGISVASRPVAEGIYRGGMASRNLVQQLRANNLGNRP
jgi:type IV secretion system protein VirB6